MKKSSRKPEVAIAPAPQPEPITQPTSASADTSPSMPSWMTQGFWRGKAEAAREVVIADDLMAHSSGRMAATG